MRTLRPWGVKQLARYGGLTKRWGKEGKKIQTAQESDKLFHASMSLHSGFPVWISLPNSPGDSAKMSSPPQNLPSIFKAELTVSILCMHLCLLYYKYFLYYVAEMSNCPTKFFNSFHSDHRDWADDRKWLPSQTGFPGAPWPHRPCI